MRDTWYRTRKRNSLLSFPIYYSVYSCRWMMRGVTQAGGLHEVRTIVTGIVLMTVGVLQSNTWVISLLLSELYGQVAQSLYQLWLRLRFGIDTWIQYLFSAPRRGVNRNTFATV
ncbi:hypothetical protein F4801DRAFT_531512, partial [Xylaria longipes]